MRGFVRWCLDSDDLLWSPWRAVLLWLAVVAAIIGVGWVLSGGLDSSPSPSQGNSPYCAQTGC